jgi:hypothetical protein
LSGPYDLQRFRRRAARTIQRVSSEDWIASSQELLAMTGRGLHRTLIASAAKQSSATREDLRPQVSRIATSPDEPPVARMRGRGRRPARSRISLVGRPAHTGYAAMVGRAGKNRRISSCAIALPQAGEAKQTPRDANIPRAALRLGGQVHPPTGAESKKYPAADQSATGCEPLAPPVHPWSEWIAMRQLTPRADFPRQTCRCGGLRRFHKKPSVPR